MVRARAEPPHQPPAVSLLPQLLWSLAARASDITTLQKRDVRLAAESDCEDRHALSVMMRRGKGAKMRGPYRAIATLSRTDASDMAKLLTQPRDRQRILWQEGDLCSMVRAALR